MKKIIVNSYEELSELTANIVVSTMLQDKQVNLSLTAGSTPKRMYELLLEKMSHLEELTNIHYYTFDETPIRNQEDQVVGFDNFDGLKQSFFEPAKIAESQIVAMQDENYSNFPELISAAGGLDLMVIGMGDDGHFCANMPECTQFDKAVYRVKLTNDFPWNAPYQEGLKGNYSDYMYTLGLPSLLKVQRVVLIVNGTSKAAAVKRALTGPLDQNFPATYLRLLPNLTVILDQEAAQQL